MKIKPTKSRSLSIRKGIRNDNINDLDGEKIPLLAEQPVRSLGRVYTANLSHKQMSSTIMAQLLEGLRRIDQSPPPGKFKVWCYQVILYHRIMWPLKLCEIPTSAVQRMDAKANNYIRNWLGLPRCLTDVALFGRNKLQLPLKSVTLGYKLEKARLVFQLRDSADPAVNDSKIQVKTGRKWNVEQVVAQASSHLQHQEVVGWVQHGKAGLGLKPPPKRWSKATKKERKELVISEIVNMEDNVLQVRAVSQQQQGRWTNWEAVTHRALKWADLWKIPQARLSFSIRSTYDTLPTPHNVHLWYGSETNCSLCNAPNPNLQHILTGCKSALTQGRYKWHHDQVLRKLAEILEEQMVKINNTAFPTSRPQMHFIKPGVEARAVRQEEWSVLKPGHEWQMRVNLNQQLKFPPEIAATSLRPDIVIWSSSAMVVVIAELTVPWEENMEAAFERKKEKYSNLAAECKDSGWRTHLYPVEVGSRGFVGKSTHHLLKALGVMGPRRRRAEKELAEEAEKGSFWLWLRRRELKWGNQRS